MVTQLARLHIDLDQAEAFEAAVQRCASAFETEGCGGMRLEREIEDPSRYYLFIEWDSVAAHKAAGASDKVQIWKDQVMPFFLEPAPAVHMARVASF
jgi:quinol monooxygenase YgiN